MRLHRSRPSWSVPSQWPACGAQPLGAGKALQRVIRGKQLRGDRHQRGNDRYRPCQRQAGLNA
ncbi:hypothetical protein KOXM_24257 [Klebsiella michiganensis]|nr:hypothetical protein KOXM_24257 [Klebsiella michiganensis]